MLVVDFHTLQAVNLLNLVHDIFLNLHRPLDSQNVRRRNRAFRQRSTGFHIVVFLRQNLLGSRNQIRLHIAHLRSNQDFAVTALQLLAKAYDTIDFSHDGRIGRVPGFEQLSNTRKTSRDIARFAERTRNLHQNVSSLDLSSIFQLHVSTYRNIVNLQYFPIRRNNIDRGVLRLLTGFDDDAILVTGLFVRFHTVCHVFDQVLERNLTGHFRNNHGIVRIPIGNQRTSLDFRTRIYIQRSPVRNIRSRQNRLGVRVNDTEFCGTPDYHFMLAALGGLISHATQLVDFQDTVVFGYNVRLDTGIASGNPADVERTQGKLRTRLPDGLGRDDTDRFALLDHLVGSQVAAITLGADTVLGLASQHRTDFHFFNRRILDFLRDFFRDFLTRFHNQLAGLRMIYIIDRGPTQDSFIQGFNHFIVLLQCRCNQPTLCMAVFFGNNHILRHIHQPTGQVPGIGRLQSGIGKTLTGTVGRDEVLQHRQTFLEVRENRVFDDFAPAGPGLLRLGHKSTHTAKLTNLLLGTTRSGIQHHEHRIEALAIGRKLGHHRVGQLVVSMCPDVDNLVVTLVVGDETHVVIVHHFFHVRIGFGNQFFLHLRDNHIAQVERKTALVSRPVSHALDIIQELHRLGIAALLQHIGNDITQGLLGQQGVDETIFLGNHLVEQDTSHRRLQQIRSAVFLGQTDLDPSVHIHLLLVESDDGFLGRVENRAFALHLDVALALAALGQIIQTQNHILRRNGDRSPVGRVQDVVRSQHQQLRLQNGRIAQRHMDCHLVAIEVGVEGGTAQGVQTHRLPLNQLRLECLDTQTVQGRGTVHQHRMPFQYVFEDVPYHGILTFHNLLGRFHGLDNAAFQHLTDNERLEQFRRHILGKPHFVHLQIRAYHDNRTPGVIDTLTQQVLTETSLLPFQTVGQGFQHTGTIAFGRTRLAGIVEQ